MYYITKKKINSTAQEKVEISNFIPDAFSPIFYIKYFKRISKQCYDFSRVTVKSWSTLNCETITKAFQGFDLNTTFSLAAVMHQPLTFNFYSRVIVQHQDVCTRSSTKFNTSKSNIVNESFLEADL